MLIGRLRWNVRKTALSNILFQTDEWHSTRPLRALLIHTASRYTMDTRGERMDPNFSKTTLWCHVRHEQSEKERKKIGKDCMEEAVSDRLGPLGHLAKQKTPLS